MRIKEVILVVHLDNGIIHYFYGNTLKECKDNWYRKLGDVTNFKYLVWNIKEYYTKGKLTR